jgi:amino acid adenylation domain-containing protein
MTQDMPDQIVDAFPLTPLQHGMLFHILSDPGQAHYAGRITATLTGPLTRSAAEAAWQVLLRRHEALRTAFLWENLDAPMQVVHAQVPFTLWWREAGEDLPDLPPVDIARAPLMQVGIQAQSADRFHLTWLVHHLVADGWSAAIVLQEFLSILNGTDLAEAPAFAAHAEWLDTLDHEADRAFWTGHFAGHLRAPLAASGDGTGFDTFGMTLTPEHLAHVNDTARRNTVTSGTVIQAAFARALGALTGTQDVLFGLATSGRSSEIEDAAGCVGLFVNTLPVRVDLTRSDLLPVLEQSSLALRSREHVPQQLLARWGNTPAGTNMVDAVLSLRSTPEIRAAGPYRIDDFAARTPSNFPLTVEVDPVTGRISALYDRAVLDPARLRSFVQDFVQALGAEYNDHLQAPAGQGLDAPLLHPPQDVLDRFLETARQHHHARALTDDTGSMSYDDLCGAARSIAAGLVAKGVEPGSRVALVLPRGIDFVTAMLGVLMAGAAYVPVDDSYPADRIAAVLADCDPRLILRGADVTALRRTPPIEPVQVPPDTPAYIIYTSGSTGTPKGVEISRAALAASQAARDQFYAAAPGAFLLLSPFAFDSSVVGIYWALTAGANLVIAAKGAEQDMTALGQLIRAQSVTHTLMLPTLYQAMLGSADSDNLTSLRLVIVAGESCPRDLPALHAKTLPLCGLANEYGPTEATVWASVDMNEPGDAAPLSIGRPIPGMDLQLLDPQGCPVPDGEVGEITLAGPALATGYFRRAAETRAAFVLHKTSDGTEMRRYHTGDRARLGRDGRLVYLGRGDRQVKIRGHRIELDEVEAAIAAVDCVREAAVRAVPARPAPPETLEAAMSHLSAEDARALIARAGGRR